MYCVLLLVSYNPISYFFLQNGSLYWDDYPLAINGSGKSYSDMHDSLLLHAQQYNYQPVLLETQYWVWESSREARALCWEATCTVNSVDALLVELFDCVYVKCPFYELLR